MEPDLAAYGVLKDWQAALFVEYDGYWRHGEKEGIDRDSLKNAALLEYAPPGSHVLRISHTVSKPFDGNVLWICVDTWRQGDQKSLCKTLEHVLAETIDGFEQVLHQKFLTPGRLRMQKDCIRISHSAQQIVDAAVSMQSGNTSEEISAFLSQEGFNKIDIALLQKRALVNGPSIQQKLQPKLGWMLDMGLSRSQVAKVVAGFPAILRYRIEQNLEPTMQWFLNFGLGKSQFARIVVRFPRILSYSIEQNFQPKVQWLLALGVSKSELAKAVARTPQILGYSIENVDAKVRWFRDSGFSKCQMTKLVARYPSLLGFSLERNLEPKYALLLQTFGKRDAAQMIAKCPPILGYSYQRLTARLRVLEQRGEVTKLASVMSLTEEAFQRRFFSQKEMNGSLAWAC